MNSLENPCPICLESMENKIKVTLTCNHSIDIICFTSMVTTNNTQVLKCPLCRSENTLPKEMENINFNTDEEEEIVDGFMRFIIDNISRGVDMNSDYYREMDRQLFPLIPQIPIIPHLDLSEPLDLIVEGTSIDLIPPPAPRNQQEQEQEEENSD